MSETDESRPAGMPPLETPSGSPQGREPGETSSLAEESRQFQSGFATPSVQEEYAETRHEYAHAAREAASEYRERVYGTIEAGRERLAVGMERGAKVVREGSEETSHLSTEQGRKLASSMEQAAGYLREHSTDEIWKDFQSYSREHPVLVLVGALLTGFVIGRMLR